MSNCRKLNFSLDFQFLYCCECFGVCTAAVKCNVSHPSQSSLSLKNNFETITIRFEIPMVKYLSPVKNWSTRIGWNSNLQYLWMWPYFEKKKSLLMTELMWVPYSEPHPTWLCPDKQRKFGPWRRMWRRRAKIGAIDLLIKAEAQGCRQTTTANL